MSEITSKYVIIGGSIAGMSAAKAVRTADADGDITVISGERTKPYYRPLIPLLIDKGDADVTMPDDPMAKHHIAPLYDTAAGLDVPAKTVSLSSGTLVHFDKLLIATGSRPVMPPIPGIEAKHVFPLRTMDDANRIRAYADGMSTAVVIGCGLVGIKAALSLRRRGLSVTIIEKLDRILYGRLDRRGAGMVLSALKQAGITVMTREGVSEIMASNGGAGAVKLGNGKTIAADIVIVAVGVTPNVDVVLRSGIKINHGIVVDEFLRTGVPDVYAAGDVVEYIDSVSGRPAMSALWTTAEEMGKTAGRNMAGGKAQYRGFLDTMNAADILDTPFISVGLIDGEEQGFEAVTRDTNDGYRKLVFNGDLLVGAVFVGDVGKAGIYTNLIRNRISLAGKKELAIRGELGFVHFMPSS